MKFLLINQPMFNRGDESAHKALVYALLQHYSSCSIEVLFTGRPQEAVDECRVADPRVSYVNLPVTARYLRTYLGNLIRNTRAFWMMDPTVRKIASHYRKADWVISSPGGRSLGADYDWDHLFFVTLAEFLGCRLAYYGRSIGPFPEDTAPHRRFAKLARRVLSRADFISLRDDESCRLAASIGLDYRPTLDTSFLYSPIIDISGRFRKEVTEGKYIVMVPNYLVAGPGDADGHSNPLRVKLFFSELSRRILETFPDCCLVMLPQLFCGQDYMSTDYAFFKDIADDVGDERVKVLPDTLISEVHQAIIAGSECLVGARYHSIVFAVNNDVPYVTLNYGNRIKALMETLGRTDRMVDITLALDLPSDRRPLPESRVGGKGGTSLPFEAEVAIARILEKMKDPGRDPETRIRAKEMTSECFESLAGTIENYPRRRR